MANFPSVSSTKIHLVVIQPTPFCNIDCSYCYLPERTVARVMSHETVRHTFRLVFSEPRMLADRLIVTWHAGEPLVAPITFYEAAFAAQVELGRGQVHVRNHIVTNGTLISQAWCELFERSQVLVGVSIDGPGWLHDRNRVDRHRRGSFDRVMRGIELLKRNKIPFKALTVLSKTSLEHIDSVWEFLKDLGACELCFNLEEVQGLNQSTSLCDDMVGLVTQCFARLLERRDAEAPALRIRELDDMLALAARWSRNRRVENVPLGTLNVAWDGSISSFCPELLGTHSDLYGTLTFGHVAKDTVQSILNNEMFRLVYGDIEAGVQECRETCGCFRFCGGGSPSNKLYENRTFASAETLNCRLRVKAIVPVAMSALTRSSSHAQDVPS